LNRTFSIVKQVAYLVDEKHYFSLEFEEDDFPVSDHFITIIKSIHTKTVLIDKRAEVIVLAWMIAED